MTCDAVDKLVLLSNCNCGSYNNLLWREYGNGGVQHQRTGVVLGADANLPDRNGPLYWSALFLNPAGGMSAALQGMF